MGRGVKGGEEGGPGSGLDWGLVELGGDAGMLQLMVLCFSWFLALFWLCCIMLVLLYFVSCWWYVGFSLCFALPLCTLASRLRLSTN